MGNPNKSYLDNFSEIENTQQENLDTNPLNSSNLANLESYETPGIEYTGQFKGSRSKYDEGIPYSQAISPFGYESRRHNDQSWMASLGNSLNQGIVGGILGQGLEGIGYLLDAKDTYDALVNNKSDVANSLSEVGKSLQDWTQEVTPIYTDPFKEGEFSPEDWSWWMNDIVPSVFSTLGLMIPSGAVVKGLGLVGKGIGLAGTLGKTERVIAKGITQAVVSRQMESMMEANSAGEATIESLISHGISMDIAKEEGAKVKAKVYKENWAMLAQDIVEYTTLIKPFGKATSDLTIKTAKKLGKDISPVVTDKLYTVGKVMVGESAEEGYQYIASERARELAEYRVGLRSKRDLSDQLKDYMGRGDFWTSVTGGAFGAGVSQTVGKSLNIAGERLRGLEDNDTKRLRDIDSWEQTIRGLNTLDATGEAIGSPNFNSKNRQVAEFGTRLSENGNLGWFLEVSDNLENMTEEDQKLFGFTPEDIKLAKQKFPNLKQDLEKIGEIYDDVINNKNISPIAAKQLVQEEFLADKLGKDFIKSNSNYQSKLNDVLDLNSTTPNVKNLIVKKNIELNNLNKVLKDLKSKNAPEEIINEYTERVSDLKEEAKKLEKDLNHFESMYYSKFNTNSTSYKKATAAFREKEFTRAEQMRASERASYYADPNNTTDINNKFIQNELDKTKESLKNAETINDVNTVTNIPSENQNEEMASITTPEAFANMVNKVKKEVVDEEEGIVIAQLGLEGNTSFGSVREAMNKKYKGNPLLLSEDLKKIYNYISGKKFNNDFSIQERSDNLLGRVWFALQLNLQEGGDLQSLEDLDRLDPNNEIHNKFIQKILDIINIPFKEIEESREAKNTAESTTIPDKNKLSGTHIVVMDKVKGRYKVKNYDNRDFLSITRLNGNIIPEIDQEVLNSGKIQIDDVVYFEVNPQDSYEQSNKNNSETRGFNLVVQKGNKKYIIGKVPKASSSSITDESDRKNIKQLRDLLQEQINSKYNEKAKSIRADITTTVNGFAYSFSRDDVKGTPLNKISKENQKEFSKFGGFVADYIVDRGGERVLSGTANMPDITEKFNDTIKKDTIVGLGGFIIPVAHPLSKGKYLYLRAFGRKIGEFKNDNSIEDRKNKYNSLIGNLSNKFLEFSNSKIDSKKYNDLKNEILHIIHGNFELVNDSLVLNRRSAKAESYFINKNDIIVNGVINPILVDWLDDTEININKDRLNYPAQAIQDIGYGPVEGVTYNELISDFLAVSTQVDNYLTNVQALVKIPDYTQQKPIEIPISKEQGVSNVITIEEDADSAIIEITTTDGITNYGDYILNEGEQTQYNEMVASKGLESANRFIRMAFEMAPPEKYNVEPGGKKDVEKEKPTKTRQNLSKLKEKSLVQGLGKKIVDSIKENKSKETDTKYRLAGGFDKPMWNEKEEINWFKKNFPNVDISVLENLREIIADGENSWGAFHNAAVYITKDAAEGTTYHEAFHVLFNLFLNENQREFILEEASHKYEVIKKHKYNSTKEYRLALEEALADDFMNYTILEQSPKSLIQKLGNNIVNFFKKLYQLIKSINTNPVYSIDELLWRGNNGFYKKNTIDYGAFGTNITRNKIKGWIYRHEKQAVEAINNYLLTEVIPTYRKNNIEYEDLTDTQIINEVGLSNLYSEVVVSLDEVNNDSEISEEIKNNINELINNFYDSETNTWKELYNSCVRGLNYNNDIKIVGKIASSTEEYDSEEEDPKDNDEYIDKGEDAVENWQNSATERSTKDTAPQEVKRFIRYMKNGKKNFLGLDGFVDYEETYNTLLRELAGSTHIDEMISYLNEEISSGILVNEYTQILDKFKEDSNFKAKFFQAFNKNHTKYNIISHINGNWAVYEANRRGLTNIIINNWSENILRNKNLIKENEKGERIINIDYSSKVVEEIKNKAKNTINNFKKENGIVQFEELSNSLNKLSINIEPKVFLNIASKGKKALDNYIFTGEKPLIYILNKFEKGLNPFDAEGGLDSSETETIKQIARAVVKGSPELYESSFRNMSGKNVYAHLEQNFLTKLTHRLQNTNRRAENTDTGLDKDLQLYYNDQFFYNMNSKGTERFLTNRILKDIEDGKNIFDIFVTEGLTDEKGDRIAFKDLDESGKQLYTIHNYFFNGKKDEGIYRGPVLSDAPVGVLFKHRKESKKNVVSSLSNLARAEYNRIKDIEKTLGNKKFLESDLIKNYHTRENADLSSGYHIIQGIRTFGKKVTLEGKNREEVENHIDNWLTKKAEDYYSSLIDNNIIVIEEGIVSSKTRLDNRIINRNGKYISEEDIKSFITDFYFNDFLSRAEFDLISVGDPAFYKTTSDSSNNKTIDYIKRAKEIYSPKTIVDITQSFKDEDDKKEIKVRDFYRTIYLKDNEIVAPSYEDIKNTYEKLIKEGIVSEQKGKEVIASYGQSNSINQTDAQAYITLPFYRETMIGLGRWTQKHQKAYKRLEKGLGTGEDLSLMLQPFKPFYYSQIYNEKIGRIVPVQNKNSEYLLLPQLVKGNTKLENLYSFMIGAKIDSINFSSAVKAGLSKVIDSTIFDTKESTESFILNEYELSQDKWVHKLNMEDRGIQQEVPEHFVDTDNLVGSQIRKLIMSDLFEGTTYMGMSAKELRDLYEDLIIQDLVEGYKDLEEKLVTSIDENGKIKVNYKALHDLLLEEALKRGKGEEFERSIQYDKLRDRLILPLYNPITTNSAQNLITSLFKSRITKQKTKGGAFVQLSSFGVSKELKLVMNEAGGLEYAEVMLPAWSRQFFKDFLNTDTGEINFEELSKYPELLDMVGYRIPTEDKYSMLPLRVVGFLPYNAGGAIMLPAEITKISGSDFDVDKMYVMMKSFKRTKEGEYKITEYSKENNNNESRDNKKLDVILSVLRNPHTFDSIMSGGTYDPLKLIAKATNNKTSVNKEEIDPISITSMDKLHTDNMTGKSMVGIAANENAFHALAQHTQLYLNTAIKFDGLELTSLHETSAKTYVKINEGNLLPKIYSTEKEMKNINQNISKNKAYYLAAIVDNAKDPIANYINYNTYTSGIAGLLTQVGLDPATITWFLKQPIIVDITDKFFKSGGDYSEERNIIDTYRTNFGIDFKDKGEVINLNTEELYDHLNDDINSDFQKDVFNSFLVYKKMAKDWTSVVLASRADTKGLGPTSADSEILLSSIEDLKSPDESFSILGTEDLFNLKSEGTKLIAAFTEYGITKPMEILKEIFPYNKGIFKASKDQINEDLVIRKQSVKELNKINNHIINYLITAFDFFNPNERDYYLNKFPQEYLEFKEKNPKFAENYLIRRLEYKSSKSDKKTPIERIEFNNTGKMTNELKNDLQQSYSDLKESGFEEMAKKLFTYTFFTTGLTYNINGFGHLTPIDFMLDNGFKDSRGRSLSEFLYDILDNSENLTTTANSFVEQYYRNEYKNKSLVPFVKEDLSNITRKLFHKDGSDKIVGFLVKNTVKDKSLMRDDKFAPFISYTYKDKIYLFKKDLDNSREDYAYYLATNKLGFPNYIQEYMIDGEEFESVLNTNKTSKKYTLDEAMLKKDSEKVTVSNIRDTEENKETIKIPVGDKIYTIDRTEPLGEKGYEMDLSYEDEAGENKVLKIVKKPNGDIININTNVILKNDSPLAKVVEKASIKNYRKTCG